ncbi:unnamed protein product [Adineta steineri]|uniref:Uncharacterized protein n=1 Tax=Adineta steineri TaxID=433720 RepID=A0A819KN01_9BILA|nr:unnamed protein product [Adineta steineri]CAF3952194.1 unnamed protein product [Adineta steineri]
MTSFTPILNLTINENDDSHSDISQISVHSATDIDQTSKHSATDINQTSKHSAIEDSPLILRGEIKDSTEQKGNNKRKKQPSKSTSATAKRQCLQLPPTIFSRAFLKSESFQRPEFLTWLKNNQHLRTITGGISHICELLDQVRMENSGLDEIFFALAENDEKVNPHFFDIKELVRRNDSIILPPEWGKWNQPTASAATYVWSFDIPIKDLERYSQEIEEDIRDHPHKDTHIKDYRPFILAQFRNYLENELPLRKKVEIFRWLYVGQTEQRPPTCRWTRYYGREQKSQRTLSYPMNNLVKRGVPHRLAVVSSDGRKNIEAVVAAMLNIRVTSVSSEANAINRSICGRAIVDAQLPDPTNQQVIALQNYNCETHMVICVHCEIEISLDKTRANQLGKHKCPRSGLTRKGTKTQTLLVHARLDTQSSCLQRIICVHCEKEQKPDSQCPNKIQRHHCKPPLKRGRSKLFQKMPWCPDEQCTECLRIEDR